MKKAVVQRVTGWARAALGKLAIDTVIASGIREPIAAIIGRYYTDTAIGIDLGTTNSCAAVMKDGVPHVIENKGERTTPSIVSFTPTKTFIGKDAIPKLVTHADSTVFSSKRLIGKKINDPEVREYAKHAPYKIVPHKNEDAWIEIRNKRYSPQEIGAEILKALKNAAEKYLGHAVQKAVITVPAYFNDAQRKATRAAGEIAGLKVLRIVNEPTAAALSYGIDRTKNGKVAVYDLGGGTFDVSILEIKDGVFEVIATNGNNHLGGDDFDNAISSYILKEVEKETGYLPVDPAAMQRVKAAAERVKCTLSTEDTAHISLPHIGEKEGMPVHYKGAIKREKLNNIVAHLVDKTLLPCRAALADAKLRKGEIDHVVVVGGMTRMPIIRQRVEEVFGKAPITTIDPDEAVAMGAAVQAGIITGTDSSLLLIDVAPLSLGIETLGGIFNRVIEKNTSIPTKKTQTFTTSEDGQTTVTIRVYEGERPLVAHNKYLGEVVLSGIPPLPKGVPKIEVIFEADANGMYTVSAVSKETGEAQEVKIVPASGLTEEEVKKIVEDAQKNRERDNQEKEFVEEKQQALEYIRKHKEIRSRLSVPLPAETRSHLDKLIASVEDAASNQELQSLSSLKEQLSALKKASGLAWRINK